MEHDKWVGIDEGVTELLPRCGNMATQELGTDAENGAGCHLSQNI